jgi:hypothetical protein
MYSTYVLGEKQMAQIWTRKLVQPTHNHEAKLITQQRAFSKQNSGVADVMHLQADQLGPARAYVYVICHAT